MPLKPCKKCGEKNIFKDIPKMRIDTSGKVYVECPCGESVGPHNNFEQATEAWNS